MVTWTERLTEALSLYGLAGVHPAADLLPWMGDDEYEALKADARVRGWQEPVVAVRLEGGLWLLDGRNRLCASVEIGKDVHVRVLPEVPDPIGYVLSGNAKRRHLSASQLAMVGARAVEMYADQARQRQREAGEANLAEYNGLVSVPGTLTSDDDAGKAAASAARDVGVSEAYVEKAKRILDTDPDLAQQVADGQLSVKQAASTITKREKSRPKEKPEPAGPVTVDLLDHQGNTFPYRLPKGKAKFNATNDSVDWAAWTWNPVTGCLHGCGYCYAREIANQPKMAASYPAKFTPLFHPERLPAPSNTRPGAQRPQDGRVFVCSMADLFGEWVPEQWIADVFAACNAAPEWEYLFLTKFPKRYRRIDLPPRMWAGASVDTQRRVAGTQKAMAGLDVAVRWLSIEPLLEPLKFSDLTWCDLMVIGAQSATKQPEGPVEAFAPPLEWVADLVRQARDAGVPVYLKANLLGTPDPAKPGMQLPQESPRRRM